MDCGAVGSGETAEAAPKHVFQALQYLRKLCSHPLMALEAEQVLIFVHSWYYVCCVCVCENGSLFVLVRRQPFLP